MKNKLSNGYLHATDEIAPRNFFSGDRTGGTFHAESPDSRGTRVRFQTHQRGRSADSLIGIG
ncbi:hypothetical protein CGZ80_06345 [Rhodopirellula sp. MGV]|nr:hypothetical protein CGZ80_06345 [Rhodopirellula sp. MGV]PNY36259.1 hypothetical protein C2E31_14240 [Rhodopirellula baltica]